MVLGGTLAFARVVAMVAHVRHETCRGDIFLQYEICFSTFFMIKSFLKDLRKGLIHEIFATFFV